MYHKDFAWNKGVWIWRIAQCLDGDIDAIIAQCKKYDISYLLIKNGDGINIWTQLSKELVRKFQDNGIKVYAWGYVYGRDPIGEANVAIQNLELGIDGYVFDTATDYQEVPDNSQAAQAMLMAIRAKHPHAFLAYSCLAIIDLHTRFPYVTFGKYCDAALPKIFYGLWTDKGQSPTKGILWMYDNWARWQQNWIDSGNEDAVKPIIPVAQAFDEYKVNPPYILTPTDIQAFVSAVKPYKAVNFYSFADITRPDCWEAIRDSELDKPTEIELESYQSPQEAQEQLVDQEVVSHSPSVENSTPARQMPVNGSEPDSGLEEQVLEEPMDSVTDQPSEPAQIQRIAPSDKPKRVEVSHEQPTNIAIPTNEKTTVTFKPSKDGSTVQATVHPKKTHREYFLQFVRYVLSAFMK
jgi:hypothetical protein